MKSKYLFNSLEVRTFFNRIFKKSDFNRWKNNEALNVSWDERTEIMSKLIEPNSTVLEFGAGRMKLKSLLPKNCIYTPSDFVKRRDGIIRCDLNKKNFPFYKQYDIVFLSGVLEYVYNISSLIHKLEKITNIIICSYATQELNDKYRAKNGWVNDYKEKTLCDIFLVSGFKVEKKSYWKKQVIFKFIK